MIQQIREDLTSKNWEQGQIGQILKTGPGFRIGGTGGCYSFACLGDKGGEQIDQAAGQKITVKTSLKTGEDFYVLSRSISNDDTIASEPIDLLEPLCLEWDLPSENWRHLYCNGGTSENCYPPTAYQNHDVCRLGYGSLRIESHELGRSSNLHLPFLISMLSVDPDSAGLFCGLEWSGHWYIQFDRLNGETSRLRAGIKCQGMILEPGETLRLPDVHIGFFNGGPDGGSNALRRYLHQQVCARYHGQPMLPRLSYDHWFNIANNFDEVLLKREARRASELGVETFVVDAAWFAGGFPHGAGNWNRLDAAKLPNGLEPVAEYVRELGMDFGLWFEPERATLDSDLYREHPEWFLKLPESLTEGSMFLGSHDRHLNLALPIVQDYLIQMVGSWIEKLDLRWSRWDYNIEPAEFWAATDPTLKIQFAYLQGLYRVLDTLMASYPDWMVECCASGGRRIDLGTLKRAHTCWFSDQSNDPFLCRFMQARANRFLPGHLLNSSVAVSIGQGDANFGETTVLSRMLGKLAFDGDIASWSPELTQEMAFYAGAFKRIRHLLVQNFYPLLPAPNSIEDWDAVLFTDDAGREAALFVFAGVTGGAKIIPLKGLSADRTYRLSRVTYLSDERQSPLQTADSGFLIELPPFEGGLWLINAD